VGFSDRELALRIAAARRARRREQQAAPSPELSTAFLVGVAAAGARQTDDGAMFTRFPGLVHGIARSLPG